MEGVDVAITASGRRSMLKLAQRMTANFCAGVCSSTVHKWNKLNAGNVDEDVRVIPERALMILRLFDFLRDERLRSEWDILSNGGPMQEMAHIAKGQEHGNCVSLLRASMGLVHVAPQQPMAGPTANNNGNGGGPERVSGSLLTVAFQILVNSLPTAKLTVESVETVNNLIYMHCPEDQGSSAV
ncbi:hypothetical protein NC652_032780 [Populus alba x Populus x berolinensis]|nr:hypothetical protein NC652_032780 [Populus alba x Populus x berolinensis]